MADESAALDALYKGANALVDVQAKLSKDGVDEYAEHAADFKAILDNAKAGPKCKQLSLQILPKYMSRFPDLADAGLDILIDLFEENEQFRMKAIEGFKVVATSATGAVIIKLIGVLSQLMQSEDEKEVAIVNDSLVAALEKDVQATVGALLEHMTTDEAFRAKALGFMQRELIPRSNKLLNKSEEAQQAVAAQIKKIIAGSSAKEFTIFMKVLFSMSIFKNGAAGAQELLEIVHNSIDLTAEFEPTAEKVEKIIFCTGSANLILKHGASPNRLITYLCKQVLPKFASLSPSQQLSLLKLLAEISPFVKGGSSREALPILYPLLLEFMPKEVSEETKINYSAVECALYSFHQIASRVPGFLHALCGIKINTGQPECRLDEDHADKLADLHQRLGVLGKQCEDFVKKLQQVSQKLNESKPETEEAKKELQTKKDACFTSLRTCKNVSQMAKNLKQTPPHFMADGAALSLSWKGSRPGAGDKRVQEQAGGASKKQAIEPYRPNRGGRGGGGGGGRGRGGAGGGGFRGGVRGGRGGRGGFRGRGGRGGW